MSISNVYNYIASQCRAELRRAKELQGFVTISRQTGAGGIVIGQKLALYLDKHLPGTCPWTVFDKNLVDEIIKDHHLLSKKIVPFLQEKAVSDIEETLEEMFGAHPLGAILVGDTNDTILRLARMGRVILVGRGSSNITSKILGGVHIRLVGSFKSRRDYTKEYLKCSDKEAEEVICKEDTGRKEYLKQNFNQDINDPLLYDLVINTDSISLTEAVSLIGGLVLRKMSSTPSPN